MSAVARFDGRRPARGRAIPFERGVDTWAADAAGDVLLLAAAGGPYDTAAASARWLDPSGAPLTPWFDVGDQYLRYAS